MEPGTVIVALTCACLVGVLCAECYHVHINNRRHYDRIY